LHGVFTENWRALAGPREDDGGNDGISTSSVSISLRLCPGNGSEEDCVQGHGGQRSDI
jgi:hypothetical protein